ncbi:EF-hand and coiled-coil domain-containing protein 1 isoform X1 [Podarcis lilfordi]|uniref:EF-hand and coiled-coil domain-containing protein 1 isoform X1 n=1 Tax=Podarcis lilfordi TaxID=74358 RepID=A0AA35JXW5_9SAUR|nr:EF-hand and coiled-coil domain-containing protein 1 isoform X1 [Podarcis lilfordi]
MEPSDGWDPYGRPARRTQWLVSALAYHYGLDRGVENEIVVLATGLDQYLQEIFHHLDCEAEGRIPGEDFRTLCGVLGLQADGGGDEAAADPEECAGLYEDVAPELTFRQFHAKLCGYFSAKAGCPATGRGVAGVARLPAGKESEHIETQIRLRSPLRRRREKEAGAGRGPSNKREGGRRSSSSSNARGSASTSCTSSPSSSSSSPPPSPPGPGSDRRLVPSGSCSRECYEEIVALEQAEDRIVKLEDENASLRELVEDMRAALQSSDARCLALQVGLWKSHANHKNNGTCFISNRTQLANGQSQTSKCLQSVLKEVELIRSSRDGQIEEAIRFNQELEKELRNSHEALVALEDCNRSLKREQAEMRKKVEEARYAVLNSLGKVKELEAKAHKMPQLQIYIQQLESELQYYRLEVLKHQLPSQGSSDQKTAVAGGQYASSVAQRDRSSPTGGAGMSENGEEQMFRSVEGQAASDEEEEKWSGEQQSQVAEVKKLLARLPCCSSGCDDTILKKLMASFGNIRKDDRENTIVELVKRLSKLTEQLEMKGQEVKTLGTNMEEMKGPLLGELQQKLEETELLKMEMQMLETERVRLSLVEEKLLDVLQLLQQLRDLNISKRALGKILLSTLESCCDPEHGKPHIIEVLDTLYHELTACELIQSKPHEKTPGHQSLANSLVISC